VVGEVEEFLTGKRGVGEASRVLLTVMFSDIVASTQRAADLGDTRWRDLLAQHDRLVRRELARFGGEEVKTIGDGFLATFAGPPSAAIQCADSLTRAAQELDLELRVGLHVGECELIDGDVGGMAVHVAARINALAAPGEVLASSAVAEAVAGAPFSFDEREAQDLKGVPGHWPLFSLAPR
jgi:class 3 adenylate cyclase